MKQIIYGLIAINVDGSAHMQWYRNKAKVDELLNSELDIYYANDCMPATTLTFPVDLDLIAAGFRFRD